NLLDHYDNEEEIVIEEEEELEIDKILNLNVFVNTSGNIIEDSVDNIEEEVDNNRVDIPTDENENDIEWDPAAEADEIVNNIAHALYSGTLEAFLKSNKDNNRINNPRTLNNNETLRRAAAWLAENNPYLRPFMNLLSSDNTLHTLNDPFPRVSHIQTDTNAPPVNSRDIVVSNYDFPSEVETLSPLAIVVISSVREVKTSPEYTTTPPTVFMAESRWSHLHDILAASDNSDTLPTNRPFHITNYFVYRFQSLKKELYKKPDLTGFGDITNFFDRVEFQNRVSLTPTAVTERSEALKT
ncbi:hypothetical protein C1646_770536, partial [Rhizophagus diaphanus]